MSVAKLHEHRQIWAAKPALRAAYEVWFDALLEGLAPGARVLEIGAGPGLLRDHARSRRPDVTWVSSDLLRTPWNDVAADAHRLPVRAAAVDRVVGLDVLHHLAAPRDFLSEAARVTAPGGQLRLLEPWVTPFSFPIYRWLHEEGCRPRLDPWQPFGAAADGKAPFTGDAAVLWSILRSASPATWSGLGLEPPRLARTTGVAWLATLGFRPGSLLPDAVGPALRALDRGLRPLAPVLGMRALATWARIA
jgi:SAM-dependent methyltransferase